MRKTVLVLWLVVLVGAVCAWAKLQPEPSEIIMEIDKDAGEVGLIILTSEDGSWLEPMDELPEKKTGERRESVKVYDAQAGKLREMSVHEYLVGVVSGEMPASYQLEALKAQAVAARTYLERKIASGGCNEMEGADICTNSAHCQAFCTLEKRRSNWGENFEKYSDKIEEAVNQTAGEVLTYDGRVIEALYHSSSGGSTEDVAAVYGNSLSYLVSVDSPENIEDITVQTAFSRAEFVSAVKKEYPSCGLTASGLNKQVYIESYTESGRAAKVKLGKVILTAREFRGLMGLRSTDMSIAFDKDNIYFTTVGYGHGVGMSQVGANIMAKDGAGYKEILRHYYKGVEIE